MYATHGFSSCLQSCLRPGHTAHSVPLFLPLVRFCVNVLPIRPETSVYWCMCFCHRLVFCRQSHSGCCSTLHDGGLSRNGYRSNASKMSSRIVQISQQGFKALLILVRGFPRRMTRIFALAPSWPKRLLHSTVSVRSCLRTACWKLMLNMRCRPLSGCHHLNLYIDTLTT